MRNVEFTEQKLFLRQSHVIRLAISLINFIWQELLLTEVSTSYPKGLMLIASSPPTILKSQSKKIVKVTHKTDHALFFLICLIFVFDFCKSFMHSFFKPFLILEEGCGIRENEAKKVIFKWVFASDNNKTYL